VLEFGQPRLPGLSIRDKPSIGVRHAVIRGMKPEHAGDE
jgi:hypothetical protein